MPRPASISTNGGGAKIFPTTGIPKGIGSSQFSFSLVNGKTKEQEQMDCVLYTSMEILMHCRIFLPNHHPIHCFRKDEMKLYGLEYFILPLVSLSYLSLSTDFTWVGILFNNAIITVLMGVVAYMRSQQIAKLVPRRDRLDRLDSMWPAFAALVLIFLGFLQLVLSVTHLSYYRSGPLVDLFDA